MVLDLILAADEWLFSLINQGFSNFALDGIFMQLTAFGAFFLWLAAALVLLYQRKKKSGISLLISLLLNAIVILSMKGFFMRPRPSGLIGANVLVNEPDSSFPSGHAAVAFSSTEVLGKYYPHVKNLLYVFAVITAISRVYIGVHYPVDVIGGTIVGLAIGYVVNRLPIDDIVERAERRYRKARDRKTLLSSNVRKRIGSIKTRVGGSRVSRGIKRAKSGLKRRRH